MTVSTNHYHRLYRPVSFLIFVLLMAAGCAHIEKQAPRAAVAKQLVENSTTMEKRGDIVTAVEDLKIALTIDPNSIKAHAELNRLIDERNRNAEQHYRAGIAASNSNTQEARKEFLAALRLRPDYSESITALRELQLATAEAIIQVRLQKEAAHTKTRLKSKVYTEEDDPDMETYSLDIAVSAFEKGDYEYMVLVTKLPYSVEAIAQLYRERADSENPFDELKNQWGWGGFTTADFDRCQIMARYIGLIYNWWSLFVRLLNPDKHSEAITSRPMILGSVARQTQHAGQKRLTISLTHGKAGGFAAPTSLGPDYVTGPDKGQCKRQPTPFASLLRTFF